MRRSIRKLSISWLGPALQILAASGCVSSPQAHLQSLQSAAEKGDARSEYELALCYARGRGLPQDYTKAAEYIRKSAEQGYAPAQTGLGAYYARGFGVPQDYSEALQWYRQAAAQGDALAQYSLGYAYAHGAGTATNFDTAVAWWQKSAEQDQVYAQYALGQYYLRGEYPGDTNHVNHAEAARWYRRAAGRGYPPAMSTLGYMYQYGVGVGQDWTLALQWNRRAAEKGDPAGQDNLGQMYENGNAALPRDLVQAYKWFWLSQQQGDAGGQHDAMEIELNHALTPEQIAEAKRMAAEFQAQMQTHNAYSVSESPPQTGN